MKIKSKKLTPEAINWMAPVKVKGGWLYKCDGMPRIMGCGEEVVVSRQWVRTGLKSTGWLVCNGLDDDGEDDPTVGLSFCPNCADIVLSIK